MKNKRPLIYLGIVIVLALAVLLIEGPESLRVNDSSENDFVPDFDSAKVERIEVEQLIDGASLKRDGENWLVAEIITPSKKNLLEKEGKELPPQKWHGADRSRVNSALGIFGGMEQGVMVSTNPEKQPLYHVNASSGLKVKLFDAKDNLIADVVIGKNGPDLASNYIRRASDDSVYLIPRAIMGIFTPRADDWRERRLWSIEPNDIKGVEVKIGKKEWAASKGEDNEWTLTVPPNVSANSEKIREFVKKISDVRARGFADEVDIAAAGIDKPASQLSISYGDGKTVTLTVGKVKEPKADKKTKEDVFYGRLEGSDQIYTLEKEFADSIPPFPPE